MSDLPVDRQAFRQRLTRLLAAMVAVIFTLTSGLGLYAGLSGSLG